MSKLFGILSIVLALGCSSTSKHVVSSQPSNHQDGIENRIDDLTYHTDSDWSYGVPTSCIKTPTNCNECTVFDCHQLRTDGIGESVELILLYVGHTDMTLEDYTIQTIKGFSLEQAIALQVKAGKIDGLDASLTVFEYSNKPIIDYHFITIFNGKVFSFSCATELPVKTNVIQECKKTLRSIKIVR